MVHITVIQPLFCYLNNYVILLVIAPNFSQKFDNQGCFVMLHDKKFDDQGCFVMLHDKKFDNQGCLVMLHDKDGLKLICSPRATHKHFKHHNIVYTLY